MMEYPYQIFNPEGACVLQAPEKCRYSSNKELHLLEAGYVIKLNGKKLKKTEIRKKEKRSG